MFHYIYVLPWNGILLLMPIMTILTIGLVLVAEKIIKKTKWVYITLFVVWIAVAVYITLISREAGEYAVSLKPFASYVWALTKQEYYRTNFMNILLFFPGGVFMTLSLSEVRGKFRTVVLVVLILMGMSVFIEALQYFLARGTAEVDDVIHNTLGAVFGCGAALLAERVALLIQNRKSFS